MDIGNNEFDFRTAGRIRLSTLHSSKGLDFPTSSTWEATSRSMKLPGSAAMEGASPCSMYISGDSCLGK